MRGSIAACWGLCRAVGGVFRVVFPHNWRSIIHRFVAKLCSAVPWPDPAGPFPVCITVARPSCTKSLVTVGILCALPVLPAGHSWDIELIQIGHEAGPACPVARNRVL